MTAATKEREALRQQMLLRALLPTVERDAHPQALRGWARAPRAGIAAGVAAYRGNAGALAERALASAFPTVAALVGEESFGALARDFWRHHAPERGDLAQWGAELPAFIAAHSQLADEAYLADSATLDLTVHRALHAADADAQPLALDLLASTDPDRLALEFAPGAALLHSAWPVATIWLAHQRAADDPERFADVQAAFAARRGEAAFVWRDGFAVRVAALDSADAAFNAALLARLNLADALDAAGADFAFDRWLARALGERWLAGIASKGTP